MTTFSLASQSNLLPNYSPDRPAQYSLRWRQKQLLVKPTQRPIPLLLPPLRDSAALTSCLQRSPIQLVRIAPELGESEVEFWADACAKARKRIFLNLPSPSPSLKQQKFKPNQSAKWGIKRLMDWMAALMMLLLLTPLLLLIAGLLWLKSPDPVFVSQWRIGKRGRLFRIFKFRTIDSNSNSRQEHKTNIRSFTPNQFPALEDWLHQSGLSELPQLINVLRGEMSLVGPRPWHLADTLCLDRATRQQLNSLPGITGIWPTSMRSSLPDLEEMNKLVYSYLNNWSIRQDLKILLLTIPKVIRGIALS